MAKNSIRSMFQVPTRDPDAATVTEPTERKARSSTSSMGKDAEIALLNARVAELEKASVVELRIDTLVIDPSRRRIRSPEKYQQLKSLIATQGQTDPIKVFRRNDGRIEVFEGHNRIEIHVELGREFIKAIFLTGFDQIEAEKLAVTSNSVQSESSTYYVYSSAKRLIALGVDLDEICDLLDIKPITYAQIARLDVFPESCLNLLRETGLRIGANRVTSLATMYQDGDLTEEQLRYVISEINAGSFDSLADIIEDAKDKFPAEQLGQTEAPTRGTAVPKTQTVELQIDGKKFGKFVRKTSGAATITLSPKAPQDLIDQIESLIQTYKS